MSTIKNSYEARLQLVRNVAEVLYDLAGDDDLSEDEMLELRRQLGDVADALLEELGAEVVEVKEQDYYLVRVKAMPSTTE